MTKRTRELDISKKVKDIVWERDEGRCIICDTWMNVMPNSHYIPRSRGGLGIEQNVACMCQDCHYKYDFGYGEEREAIRVKFHDYLERVYDYWLWEEEKLVYKKA